jgi:hypothetical protein
MEGALNSTGGGQAASRQECDTASGTAPGSNVFASLLQHASPPPPTPSLEVPPTIPLPHLPSSAHQKCNWKRAGGGSKSWAANCTVGCASCCAHVGAGP